VRNLSESFSAEAARLLQQDLTPRIRASVESLDDEEIWWRPNESSNSIGNLVLHLCGNLRQWIIAGLSGSADLREREREFSQRAITSGKTLLEKLDQTVAEAVEVIGTLGEEKLSRQYRIQVYDVTGLQALFHVAEHYSHHTGQILYITKMLKGQDLGFYSDLSPEEKPTN